jgi:methionine synthase I (cobalamin-dependent)
VKRSDFDQLISQRILVADGAMGTMLYEHGVFLNRCFDELNLAEPSLVRQVHEEYVKAGADLVETNTFGANRLKLSKYGLANEVGQINRSGVRIAKEAAGGNVLVAGSIGPLGCELTEHSPVTRREAQEIFREQGTALVEAGVDLLILETFLSEEELLIAVKAVGELADVPIIAQMTVSENGETIYGEPIEQAISKISREPAVAAVGLNCSVGPSGMLSSLERIRPVTTKPIAVQPNAGMPRLVEGRQLYMSTPEYMAEYAKRFLEKGARIIGGCCGTTPDHIREIARAVRSMDKAMSRPAISVRPSLLGRSPISGRSWRRSRK